MKNLPPMKKTPAKAKIDFEHLFWVTFIINVFIPLVWSAFTPGERLLVFWVCSAACTVFVYIPAVYLIVKRMLTPRKNIKTPYGRP